MKLTKKALDKGQVVKQGNVSAKMTNGGYMVQDHTGNWEGFESYKETKEEYYRSIEIAEHLGLQ